VKRTNEAIAKTIADLGNFAQLLLIPMHPDYHEDIATAKIIQGYMKNPSRLRIVSRRHYAITLMNLISQCELLFAGRLGSAVFATITATPVIAIAYEPRMVDHMDRIGFGQYVFDWKNLKYEELAVKAKEIWQSRNSIKESMKVKVKEFREMAWENAKMIDTFI
jgi:polysaccharide pyruvyl transferase WcaK-like protein